jgi:hypothetical protein
LRSHDINRVGKRIGDDAWKGGQAAASRGEESRGGAGGGAAARRGGGGTGDDTLERKEWVARLVASWVNCQLVLTRRGSARGSADRTPRGQNHEVERRPYVLRE